MNFNTTLYTGSKLFTTNRNKFDFSDEQLIVCFYNYAYCVREIAMVRLIEYCRYVSKNTNRLVNSKNGLVKNTDVWYTYNDFWIKTELVK